MSNKYSVYYGRDCDSNNGFNDGQYLTPIETNEPMAALESIIDDYYDFSAMSEQEYDFRVTKAYDENEGSFELITEIFDQDGNNIHWSEYDNDKGHSYLYRYWSYQREHEVSQATESV